MSGAQAKGNLKGTKAALSAISLLALSSGAGCVSGDADQSTIPAVVGMSSTVAPLYEDGETTIYQVATPFTLPVRKPTAEEASSLKALAPYPRAPFLLGTDVSVTIRFTISNLDKDSHAVELLVDPWNEFVHYQPELRVSEEATTPDFSGFDKFFVVPGMGRIQGIITPDDTHELAVDLATVMNIAKTAAKDANQNGLFNRTFNLQNRSSEPDPLITKFIPGVIPGLTGFDMGLRAYGKMNIALEFTVDTVDNNGNRTTEAGSVTGAFGKPGTALSPPAPPVQE